MTGKDDKPHFHVTAALIWKENKVLIARRPMGSHLAGLWEFPGGKQERGESLEACLEREIKEELNFDVKANQRLMAVEHEYGSQTITLHVFDCTALDGEPAALQHQQIRWVAPSDLKEFAFSPPDKVVIEFLKGGTPFSTHGSRKGAGD